MIQTLIKNWWLLALCGAFDAVCSATNFLMQDPDGSLTLRKFAGPSAVVFLGKFALAAGASTIAAGIWSSGKGKSWMLAMNGLALSAFGLISVSWLPRGRLSFLPVALLFVVMAMSVGIFALATARTLRRHVADQWFLCLAGAASVGFALAFFAFGFRWIQFGQPGGYFLWMSSYFGFSAICMLGLGLRLNSVRAAIHRMAGNVLPAE